MSVRTLNENESKPQNDDDGGVYVIEGELNYSLLKLFYFYLHVEINMSNESEPEDIDDILSQDEMQQDDEDINTLENLILATKS